MLTCVSGILITCVSGKARDLRLGSFVTDCLLLSGECMLGVHPHQGKLKILTFVLLSDECMFVWRALSPDTDQLCCCQGYMSGVHPHRGKLLTVSFVRDA